MPRVLCIHLPFFRTERLSRSRAQLKQKAFVVHEAKAAATTKNLKILEVSSKARVSGIRKGLTVAEGQASCPDLLAFPAQPADDLRELETLGLWSRCFAPQSYVYGDSAVVVLLDQKSQIFGGEGKLLKEAQRRLQQLGYSCQLAIAETPAAAWALAAFGRSDLVIASSEEQEELLNDLPIEALGLPLNKSEELANLGLFTIEQLQNIESKDLANRWPDVYEALCVLSQAELDPRKKLIQQPLELSESWDFEDPVEQFRILEKALEILVERLCVRLQSFFGPRGVRSLNMEFMCHERSYKTHVFNLLKPKLQLVDSYQLTFRQSYRSAKSLLERLIESLESRQPEGPFQHIKIEVCQFEEPKTTQQHLFFQSPDQSPLGYLLDSLNQRLGLRNVRQLKSQSDHRPERQFRFEHFVPQSLNEHLGLNAKQKNKTQQQQRPLRLYTKAMQIFCKSRNLRPFLIQRQKTQYSLKTVLGPERIQSNFWDDPIHRDYYKVELSTGFWTWIYYDYLTKKWFEHGSFD